MARKASTKTSPSTLNSTKNSLKASTRQKVVALLNARLADAIDLRLQAKQAHWNVKGPHFIGLHELFDDIAEGVEKYVDEIAERAVALGGVAAGTTQAVAAATRLPEYPVTAQKWSTHVEGMSTALGAFGKAAREAIDTAEDLGDAGTADLFTDISRDIDKWTWFVEAHGQ
jgi:starvation-inducible DNA-binding protein